MNDNVNSVQNQSNYSTGRELFFYLLSFLTLFLVCLSLGSIIFAAINKWVPDEIYYYGPRPNLAWALSALLVSAPLYWLINWRLEKELVGGKLPRVSRVRKVLFYLALVVASAVVLGDVITLLYRFFNGELNGRFGIKVLTILLLGGWVIWYYGKSLSYDNRLQNNSDWFIPNSWFKSHSWGLLAVLIGGLAVGFSLQGSPVKQQKIKQDQKTLSEVQAVYFNLQNYYSVKGQLPVNLSDASITGFSQIVYKVTGNTKSQLCAEFNYDAVAASVDYYQPRPVVKGALEPDWNYKAGQHCFAVEVFKPLKDN